MRKSIIIGLAALTLGAASAGATFAQTPAPEAQAGDLKPRDSAGNTAPEAPAIDVKPRDSAENTEAGKP